MYILFLYFSLLTSFLPKENPQLTIEIQNIESLKGDIRIGVFNANEKFLKENYIFRNYKIAVKNNTEAIVIDDLPKGDYAFILYHDRNADGKLNRSILGVPKEAFGFSNNVRPKLSKPTFEECKFSLKEDLVLTVELGFY